jgi:ABC-type uncharacterized transport system ATPase component
VSCSVVSASCWSATGATAEPIEQLRQAELDLDEPFLLVVVGEFNAGKSAFVNALSGEAVLREKRVLAASSRGQ